MTKYRNPTDRPHAAPSKPGFEKRNEDLFADAVAGADLTELSRKWNLSKGRINQIVYNVASTHGYTGYTRSLSWIQHWWRDEKKG